MDISSITQSVVSEVLVLEKQTRNLLLTALGMSRFFATTYDYESGSSSSEEDLLSSSEEELLGSSSSEDESNDSFFDESESESDFGSDDSDAKPYGPDWFKKPEFRKAGGGGSNKFLKGASYSDSEESSDDEGKKVIKSAKEKLLDELQSCYDKIETAEMTQDWITILNEFDNSARLLVRAQQQNYGVPNIFIKVVAQVEDAVATASQNEINNKAVARAFNTCRQRVKKVVRENEASLARLREDPESFDKEPTVDLETRADFGGSTLNFSIKKGIDLDSVAMATSEAGFFPTLSIVLDSRGKKNVDREGLIRTMEELLAIAKTPYESILAYLTLIPIRLDSSVNLAYQPIDEWKATSNDINSLLDLLEQNIDKYQVSELAPRNDFIENEPESNEKGIKLILGSLFSFTERLDDEFNKSLLNTDPHSSDYLLRLRDEQDIYNMIIRTQLYLEAILPEEEHDRLLARAFVKRLDHIYYKPMKMIGIMERTAWSKMPSLYSTKYIPFESSADEAYVTKLINALTGSLAKQNDSALRKRGVLYSVYFTALNKDYHAAKEELIESKVQSYINKSDPSLQILFNRVVVQLGLAAFKLSLVEDCHQVLNDLLSSSHLREILGQQTLQRITANSTTSSADEREKLCLPYHQHINLDLIDLVFMTCSLLIEVPQMAAFYSGIRVKRIPYSQKSIRRSLEHYDKSSFQGPPETLRDYVLQAAKAMQRGDWKDSVKYLRTVQTWKLLPNFEEVLSNLTEVVQVEALKTYFFSYKRFYSKFSVKKLSDLFDIPESKIVKVLDAVISEYEIAASLDDDKATITIEKNKEITKLEEVASKLNKEIKIVKERLNPHPHRRKM